MENKQEYHFFWSGVFSNWHPSKFIIDGVEFKNCEQYMMYKKALMFYDYDAAKKIMQTSNPKEQKAIGRQVKNFKDDVWVKYCRDIVCDANYAKFTQNKDMLEELLSTGNKELVEASPHDLRWGCGLEESNPFIHDKSNWPGTNWLGEVLTKLRNDLKNELI